MKLTSITAVMLLLLGCVYDDQAIAHRSPPATQEDATAIATASVKAKEKWKRVGSDVKKLDNGWRVFVARVPSNFGTPFVIVTVDENGEVTGYQKGKFDK